MAVNSTREDEHIKQSKKMETMLRLFSYLMKYKKEVIFVLLIMGICVAISLINPIFMELAVDKYLSVKDFKGLLILCSIALALNILYIIFIKVRMNIMNRVCNTILVTIRQELYIHIQTLDFSFFDSRPTGKILSRIIGDVNSLKDVLDKSVTILIPDFLTLVSVVAIMFIKNPPLAAASLCSLPVLLIGMWLIQIYSHKRWQIFRKKSANLNAFLHEDISGMKVIHSFHAQKETSDTFDELVKEHRLSFNRAVRLNDAFGPIIDFCWGFSAVALFYTAIKILGTDKASVGTLVAFSSYIFMFWRPISNLADFYNQLITNIAGAERIFEIMDTPSQINDKDAASTLSPIKGAVEFSHVSFAYQDAPDVFVLKDVSFSIKPGETIALVGPTGAGKTTIVNLISRFYDASDGNVTIDGTDVKKFSLESLRSQMGIMTQDTYLFSGTIKENIRYGKLDATDEEIIAAAKAVHAHDFIMKFEKGYDTVLSERGGGLSIGQRQLIAFARTFVSMPGILILDEATSSIDTQTELLVQQGIESLLKGRTSFVIAHRLSTIKKADRIFYIDHGGIVEQGTQEELLKKKGAYYELYMAQGI